MTSTDAAAILGINKKESRYLHVVSTQGVTHLETIKTSFLGRVWMRLGCGSAAMTRIALYIIAHQEDFQNADGEPAIDKLRQKIEKYANRCWVIPPPIMQALDILQPSKLWESDIHALTGMDTAQHKYLQVAYGLEGLHLRVTKPLDLWSRFLMGIGYSSASFPTVFGYINRHKKGFTQVSDAVKKPLLKHVESYVKKHSSIVAAQEALQILRSRQDSIPIETKETTQTIDIKNASLEERLGNQKFLAEINKTNKARCKSSAWCAPECQRPDDPTLIAFKVLEKLLKEKDTATVQTIFPLRTVTADDVRNLSVENLLLMSPGVYMSICDLINGEQALEILLSKTDDRRKHVLFFYNESFAMKCAAYVKERTLFQPICPEILKEVALFFADLKPNPSDTMDLLKQPFFPKLDQMRQGASKTLSTLSESAQPDWAETNSSYLSKEGPVYIRDMFSTSIDMFLSRLNSSIRSHETWGIDPFEVADNPRLEKGVRQIGREVQCTITMAEKPFMQHFVPSRQVMVEVWGFAEWLKKEKISCASGKSNPITVAARAFAWIITTHPWNGGNARTARMFADRILVEFGLLPVAWGISSALREKIETQLCVNLINLDTVSTCVAYVIAGLKESYKIKAESVV